jgi:hypothetical protein
LLVLVEVVEHGLSPVYDFSRQTISRSRKAGDRTMPEKIIQVNQPMFETELDRMVSEKVNEIRGPDAGRFRPTRSPARPATSAPMAGRRIGLVIMSVI